MISNLFLSSKNRAESGKAVLKNLALQVELQELQMRVYMTLGELEALKADHEFEYLEGKLRVVESAVEKAKQDASSAKNETRVESQQPVNEQVDLNDLYKNQSPLFDFLSDRHNPRTYYVEQKEIINPHDMEDRTCIKHNDDFKVVFGDIRQGTSRKMKTKCHQ